MLFQQNERHLVKLSKERETDAGTREGLRRYDPGSRQEGTTEPAARRIWCRIRGEMPEVEVAESTIRRYIRERKIEMGLTRSETFIPGCWNFGTSTACALAEDRGGRNEHGESTQLSCFPEAQIPKWIAEDPRSNSI